MKDWAPPPPLSSISYLANFSTPPKGIFFPLKLVHTNPLTKMPTNLPFPISIQKGPPCNFKGQMCPSANFLGMSLRFICIYSNFRLLSVSNNQSSCIKYIYICRFSNVLHNFFWTSSMLWVKTEFIAWLYIWNWYKKYILTYNWLLLSEFLDRGELLDKTVLDMEELAADNLSLPRPRLAGLVGAKKTNYILKILDNTHTQYAYHSNCYLPIICIINSLNLICSSRLSDVVPNSCPRPSLSAWCRWRVGCLNKNVVHVYIHNCM